MTEPGIRLSVPAKDVESMYLHYQSKWMISAPFTIYTSVHETVDILRTLPHIVMQ